MISTLIWPVIITPMASDAFLSWANRTVLRPCREEPYLSIQDIVVFVRDVEVSKRFYLEQLGFELLTDQRLPTGERLGASCEAVDFAGRCQSNAAMAPVVSCRR